MNSHAGFGSGGAPYEVAVREAKSGKLMLKKALLILAYVGYAAGLLLLGTTAKLILPLLALLPVTLWIIVFFTWRYTQVQYEYSFFAGEMTVCRILGDRFRKTLVKVPIALLCAVLPYEEDFTEQIKRFDAQDTIFAASSLSAPSLRVALWKDPDDGRKLALLFEPDDHALKILHYYNAAALTLRK
ncbi:MAG: hypothetical protein IIX80_00210 [Clostridia bacterium]|nr:hypothetical protein [Clostridia bacterium]